MSSSGASITLQGEKALQQALSQAAKSGSNLRPAFCSVGEYLMREVNERFQNQIDPEGEPWVPLSLPRIKEKGNERILQDTGRLQRSITYQAGPLTLTQGTNLEYAAIHQFGGQTKREARQGSVRLRTDSQGNPLSQASLGKTFRNAKHLRVFARKTHKRFIEKTFTIAERDVTMPARPYLGVNAENLQEIARIIRDWIQRKIQR